MSLETVTHISDLVATNPTSGDPVYQGDDHLRNIKSALKTDFPNIAGVVSASNTELSYVAGVTSALQTQLDAKAPIASPTFTGTPAAPTATGGTNTTQLATTAFVQAAVTTLAPLASPTFTGTPVAPTPTTTDSTTKLATTAMVHAAILATFSKGNPGWIALPADMGGIVIQWGSVSAVISTSNQTINFPHTFPTACRLVLTNIDMNDTAAYGAIYNNIVSKSTTSFTTNYTASRNWIAIGD